MYTIKLWYWHCRNTSTVPFSCRFCHLSCRRRLLARLVKFSFPCEWRPPLGCKAQISSGWLHNYVLKCHFDLVFVWLVRARERDNCSLQRNSSWCNQWRILEVERLTRKASALLRMSLQQTVTHRSEGANHRACKATEDVQEHIAGNIRCLTLASARVCLWHRGIEWRSYWHGRAPRLGLGVDGCDRRCHWMPSHRCWPHIRLSPIAKDSRDRASTRVARCLPALEVQRWYRLLLPHSTCCRSSCS